MCTPAGAVRGTSARPAGMTLHGRASPPPKRPPRNERKGLRADACDLVVAELDPGSQWRAPRGSTSTSYLPIRKAVLMYAIPMVTP